MTFEADLVTFLTGDPAIAAALSDQAANEARIFPLERPRDQKSLPALVYTVIAGQPAANLDDGDAADDVAGDLEQIRLQLDIYESTYERARSFARLVHARMKSSGASISATRISRASAKDPDTREYREVLDYSVWHSPQ